ncbi:MAG: hypothetical protein K9G34_08925, partial [Melioribacteraceae bacterium]|nr:hypothetical protein [Melioribacteraceae bacterium]
RGCDALFISMWDRLDFNTYNVNLYTGKLPKSEMNFHFFKTFLSLADTYESATGKKDIAEMIRNFSEEFGRKLDILDDE